MPAISVPHGIESGSAPEARRQSLNIVWRGAMAWCVKVLNRPSAEESAKFKTLTSTSLGRRLEHSADWRRVDAATMVTVSFILNRFECWWLFW